MTGPASGDAEVAALRQEIAQTRADLGETVEALAARTDVKARAQEKVDETKARFAEMVTEAKDKARVRAQQVAATGQEVVRQVQADPAVAARRYAEQARASVQAKPKQWGVAAAAVVAFALLLARKRARRAARRAKAKLDGTP